MAGGNWRSTLASALAEGIATVNKPALRKFASLGSRGVASISDQAATAAVSFAVSVFVGRHIGVDALGIYATTNALVMLIRALQNSVVLEPMAVFGSRRLENYGRYFAFLVGLQGLTIGFFSLLFAAGAVIAYFAHYLEREGLLIVLASCLYVNFLCFQMFLRRQFYIDHRQYMATIQSVSFLLLVIAGLAALWQVDGVGVGDVYNLLTACSVVVCLVQGGRFWSRMHKPSRAEVRRHARDHWSFGKWILLGVPVGILSYQGFFPFVGFAVSHEAAGLLKAAEALISPFTQVVIGMQLMLVPMTARKVDTMPLAAQKRLAARISLAFLAVSLAYSAAVYLTRDYTIVLLFGEKMRDAVPILAVLSLFPLFRGMPMAAGVILTSRKQANLRFLSQLVSTVLTLLVGIPLVVYGGVIGAAAGLVASQIFYAASIWACLFWLWRKDGQRATVPA